MSGIKATTTNGIFNEFHQHYLNDPAKTIVSIPNVDLAYISNLPDADDSSVYVSNYSFNVIRLNFSDFSNLFFNSPLRYFNINPANVNVKQMSLNQTYIDTTNKEQTFSLIAAMTHAWSEFNKQPVSNIPANKKISLIKNSGLARNLGAFRNVQNALSFNESINMLLQNQAITPDENGFVTIDFNVFVQYTSVILGVSVNMKYTYRVDVPGYRYLANNNVLNNVYSKDTTPVRSTFDFKIPDYDDHYEESVQEKPEEKHLNFQEDFNETSSESSEKKKDNYEYLIDDNNTLITESSNIIEKVSKIIKGDDSVADSKMW